MNGSEQTITIADGVSTTCSTIAELITERKNLPNKGVTFIESGDKEVFSSYADLYQRALVVLGALQKEGLKKGDELVFILEDNRAFVIVFWACILGGIIAVPLSGGTKDEHKRKIFIVKKYILNPRFLLTSRFFEKISEFAEKQQLGSAFSELSKQSIIADEAFFLGKDDTNGAEVSLCPVEADDIAFVQFSSGSTGDPKGVTLTHRNLITNMQDIGKAAGYSAEDTMLSWMPLTHDMGLIGFHLNPLLFGMNQYLLPTSVFVRRPTLWLEKAHQHRVSILCSPNFGYRYLIKHLVGTQIYKWDLSCVRLIYNGAEPISETLAAEFLEMMQAYGLNPKAMCPVYGLAEASLAVTISDIHASIESLAIEGSQLKIGNSISPALTSRSSISFVNVGKAIERCRIQIVDDKQEVLLEGKIGHITIQGDNVTSGYYQNQSETEKILRHGWLRTGDIGFIEKESLYIVGRYKDIIFINGQNYYPQDLERVAESVNTIELNKVVFGGYFDPILQKDVTIAFVLFKGLLENFVFTVTELREHIHQVFEFQLDHVIPVTEIPKTTSGKLQRYKLVEAYQSGYYIQEEEQLNELLARQNNCRDVVAPATVNEEKILSIWKEILRDDRIGVTQKYVELGGGSLGAVSIVAKLQQEFKVTLDLHTFWDHQTVRELATWIGESARTEFKQIPRAVPMTSYPLSLVQGRMYYAWAYAKESIAYNIQVAFKISGGLELGKLRAALQTISARHAALRMSFRMQDGNPRFYIKEDATVDLLALEIAPEALDTFLQSLARPFNLEKDNLLRVRLLESGQGQVLYLEAHHIVCDGISLRQLVVEIMAAYNGQRIGEVPIQYQDFVMWDLHERQTEADESLHYWKHELARTPTALEMPLDFPRPAVFDPAGHTHLFALQPELVTALKETALENNCTLHSLLFSAYALLLSRYTGQQDLTVGIPVNIRNRSDLEDVVGMFANSLPVRVLLDDIWDFSGLLQYVHGKVISAMRFSACSLDRLLPAIAYTADASRNPLFNTMFVFHENWNTKIESGKIALTPYYFETGVSKFDLSLHVYEDGEMIRGHLEYATSLFKEAKIKQFTSDFELLLQQVARRKAVKLTDITLLTKADYVSHVALLHRETRYDSHISTIHGWVEQQASKTPDKIAVSCGAEVITYNRLDAEATAFARLLHSYHLGKGDLVGLFLDRSVDFVVSVLATLKAGGAFIPLETKLPQARVMQIVDESACRLLLTEQDIAVSFKNYRHVASFRNMAILERVAESLENAFPIQAAALTKEDLAYVIFTSGTTGRPKGVMITHESLLNYIGWAAHQYVKEECATFPLFTSISFDLTITSLFTPLVTGNEIVIYPECADEILIEKVIREQACHVIKLTPAHLKIVALLDYSANEMRNIRRFIVGGERFDWDLAAAIHNKFGGLVEIFNEYGPTEATVGCMIYQFDKSLIATTVPIGKPIDNTGIFLLDQRLCPVPKGVHAEIYIAGKGLSKGYLNNIILTNEKFIDNPFVAGTKMYKTGDLAFQLENGLIEYVGRIDSQVKINGFRIELAEIEQVLNQHDAILNALVRTRKHENGSILIEAFYLAEEHLISAELRDYLADRLPHYMIPVAFTRIQDVPLTQNGKIDYAALRTVYEGSVPLFPLSEIEALTLEIWQKVLNQDRLQVSDNFFEFGGDSIKAVQIVAKLYEKGYKVNARDILTKYTVAQVSPFVEKREEEQYSQQIQEGIVAHYSMSKWFFDQSFEKENFYNQSLLLNFATELNIEFLKISLYNVFRHHDGLRLNFNRDSKVMYYNNALLEAFEIEQVYAENELELARECERIKSSFRSEGSSLFKAVVVRTPAGNRQLFLTAHHLLVDGVSWRILLEDIYIAYRQLEENKTIVLPKKTAPVSILMESRENDLQNTQSAPKTAFWNAQQVPEFIIPVDLEPSDWASCHLGKHMILLDEAHTEALLMGAHKNQRTDAQIILNAALGLTLRQWLTTDTILVEQEGHGRYSEKEDFSRTVGWFTVLYPLAFYLPGDGIAEALDVVKKAFQQLTDGGVSYWSHQEKQKALKSEKAEIRLNYLGSFEGEFGNDLFVYSQTDTGPDLAPENHFTAKIECNAMIIAKQFRMEIIYSNMAFQKNTMGKFASALEKNLKSVITYLQNNMSVRFTPADFEMAGLDQEELDTLFE